MGRSSPLAGHDVGHRHHDLDAARLDGGRGWAGLRRVSFIGPVRGRIRACPGDGSRSVRGRASYPRAGRIAGTPEFGAPLPPAPTMSVPARLGPRFNRLRGHRQPGRGRKPGLAVVPKPAVSPGPCTWRIVQLIVSGLANGCCLRPDRARLRARLQGRRAGQLRAGRPDGCSARSSRSVSATRRTWRLAFWLACAGAILAMADGGLVAGAVDPAPWASAQSQLAVVILTIAIGFVLRFAAGVVWGHEPQVLESPDRRSEPDVRRRGARTRRDRGHPRDRHPDRPAVRLLSPFTKLGVAMQASSQNQLGGVLHGHSGEADSRPGVGAGRRYRGGWQGSCSRPRARSIRTPGFSASRRSRRR